MELIFYTTSHCHLCDQAERLLIQTPLATPVPVEVVDISESADLVARYGTRIPVLQRSDNGVELNWPFDGPQIQQFIGSCKDEEDPC